MSDSRIDSGNPVSAWARFAGAPVVALLATAFVIAPPPARAQPLADHVVLISVDGFRPEFYLDTSWPAPILQQMARDGVRAERVYGVFPSVTYPSHTAMVSGAMPARHGILFNTPFEPAGATGRWYWDYDSIRVPTVWDAVRESGGGTAAISWPVTNGAPIDWVVPEIWGLDPQGDRLAPMREGTRPDDLWSELERLATGRLDLRVLSVDYLTRDDTTARMAAYLIESKKPRLLALHVLGTDHFEHEHGRDHDVVRRAVAAADRAVGAVLDAVERAGLRERTAFLITGDHGFVNTTVTVNPNVLLVAKGLRGPQRDHGPGWRATFHAMGGAAFLRLARPGDAEAARLAREAVESAPAAVRQLWRVVERAELDAAGADPEAPFALAAGLGVSLGGGGAGELLGPSSGGTHGYFPTDFPEIATGFVGWGAGFATGVQVHEMRLVDVAPLIAQLLGLKFTAPDGLLLGGMLASAK